MPQINPAALDEMLIITFACLYVGEIANDLEDFDDELLAYNNFILLNF